MAKVRKRAVKRKAISYIDAARYGIMNHIGGLWTSETFRTETLAQSYLDAQRKTWPAKGGLDRHKVVPVRVTVTATSA